MKLTLPESISVIVRAIWLALLTTFVVLWHLFFIFIVSSATATAILVVAVNFCLVDGVYEPQLRLTFTVKFTTPALTSWPLNFTTASGLPFKDSLNANETSMSTSIGLRAFRISVMIWPLRLNNPSLGTLVAQAQKTERARLIGSGRSTAWSFH